MTVGLHRRLSAGVLAVALLTGFGVSLAPVEAASAAEDCAPGDPQFTLDRPAALDDIGVPLAWEHTRGAGVLVAVVDSGIDATNQHLAGVVVGGVNLVGDGTDPSGFTDLDGHGTAIAGQIAARELPASGVVGVAPEASLLSVRIFRGRDDESLRAGFGPTTARLVAGIRFAVDSGAHIINVSLSDYADGPELQAAVEYADAHGSLVVASAGNRTTAGEETPDGPRYPAAYPGALSVTATNDRGLVTTESIHGPHVDVAAPGQFVLTTATGAGDCMYSADVPSSSFATAYASGAAALVASAHPQETPPQWEYRLQATGVRSNLDARDDIVGWGVVQPADAITLLPSATTRGPQSPFVDSSGSAVLPVVTTVTPDHEPSGLILTKDAMSIVAVGGLTLLSTIGVIIIYRARRRGGPVAARGRLGGLLDRPKPDGY